MNKQVTRRDVLGHLGAGTLAVTTAGASLPAFAQAAPGVSDSEIVIGYHGPMTGPASWVGLGGRDGALLALDEINAAGGVNGRKIRLVIYDDAGKASEAEAVTRKMIDSDKVFAILGGGVSNVAIVVGEEAHRAKVPYFNGSAGSPKVIDQKSRWVFSGATLDGRDIGLNQATFIGEHLKVKKVAVMHGTTSSRSRCRRTVVKILKDRYGVEVLTTQKYNPGDTDFSSQLLAVKQIQPGDPAAVRPVRGSRAGGAPGARAGHPHADQGRQLDDEHAAS